MAEPSLQTNCESQMVILQVKNLCKAFGGLRAVDGVTMEVYHGEILGLIGPNGAGKTTLFNLITGFLHPDNGHIFFNRKEITNLKPHVICRLGIARTFQIPRPLANLSVRDNIAIGALVRNVSYRRACEEAFQVARRVGLENKLSIRAGDLTIGDKKRLGFAQALATKPQLILLDEIASGITPTEVDQLLAIIRSVVEEGITVVMVEHVMRAVMTISTRLVVLNHGKLIAKGTPLEIIDNQAVIEAYLGEEYKSRRGA